MNDIRHIRTVYETMENEQLEELLSQAGTLRQDAMMALEAECRKRNIQTGTARNIVQNVAGDIRPNQTKGEKQWWQKVTSYAMEQKFSGASDDTILGGLIGLRASNSESLYLIGNLGRLAEEELKKAEADRVSGITRMVCGLAVIIIVYLASLGNTMMMIGGIITVAGLVLIMNAGYRKNRFKIIIANCEMLVFEQPMVDDFNPDEVIYEEIT